MISIWKKLEGADSCEVYFKSFFNFPFPFPLSTPARLSSPFCLIQIRINFVVFVHGIYIQSSKLITGYNLKSMEYDAKRMLILENVSLLEV